MTVFYRKYRPQKFADLVGQETIVETLLAQLSSGKISHGYLFAGPRGTGKTSTARIFAKAVNCKTYQLPKGGQGKQKYGEPCNKCDSCLAVLDGSHLDLIEIDAASNRGIDEIRDLREKIKLSPVSSRFKVYIIDEAHMLTTEAFNALLKTLEEPPAHAIFILCTTAANKLPATIISRLARFNFLRAPNERIVVALKKIAKAEGIGYEDEAFLEIAKASDGSFRDAVSILDQLASKGKKIRVSDVSEIGGLSGWTLLAEFAEAIAHRDLKSAVLTVEKLAASDGDIPLFVREAVALFEKVLFIKIGIEEQAREDIDKAQFERLVEISKNLEFSTLQNIMKQLLIVEGEMKIYPLPKIPLLLCVCKICGEDGIASGVEPDRPSQKKEELKTSSYSAPVDLTEVEHQKAAKAEKIVEVELVRSAKGKVKSLSQIDDNWDKFLDKVRHVNVHLVALLRSTRPVDISGDILTIEVYFRFHKDKLEEPKINKMLEGFLEEILGSRVGIKFILSQRQKSMPSVVKQSNVVDVSGEDLSSLAKEIFSK